MKNSKLLKWFVLLTIAYVIFGCSDSESPMLPSDDDSEALMAPHKPDKAQRIPALNMAVDPPVLVIVPKTAIENSPVLIPADFVILIDDHVFFGLYKQGYDGDASISASLQNLAIKLEMRFIDSCLVIELSDPITLDMVEDALKNIEDIVSVWWGRAVCWGNYW